MTDRDLHRHIWRILFIWRIQLFENPTAGELASLDAERDRRITEIENAGIIDTSIANRLRSWDWDITEQEFDQAMALLDNNKRAFMYPYFRRFSNLPERKP